MTGIFGLVVCILVLSMEVNVNAIQYSVDRVPPIEEFVCSFIRRLLGVLTMERSSLELRAAYSAPSAKAGVQRPRPSLPSSSLRPIVYVVCQSRTSYLNHMYRSSVSSLWCRRGESSVVFSS